MKRSFIFLMVAFLFSWSGLKAQDGDSKVPVTIFDFSEGPLDWTVKEFESLEGPAAYQFSYRSSNWWGVSPGMWQSLYKDWGDDRPKDLPKENYFRNTMVYSPVIDLSNKEEVDLFIDFAKAWGQPGNNRHYLYVQDVDSLNLEEANDSLFIDQWKGKDVNLEPRANWSELGLPDNSSPNRTLFQAGPISIAGFSGEKIRLAVHFYNKETASDMYRQLVVKQIQLAAYTDDNEPAVGEIVLVDSIGNTFARANYKADEICQMYWAVVPKGQTVASVANLQKNLGTDAFSLSGSVAYNTPGYTKKFMMQGLDINSEYTVFYGTVDYKGNVSEIQSVDVKTTNDLTPPVITKLEVADVSEILATVNLQADKIGTITYRLYEAGLEPEGFDQFIDGVGSVRSGTLAFDTLEVDEDWQLEYLELNTTYIVYAILTDWTGNISDIAKSDLFTTLADTKAPVIDSIGINSIENHTANLVIKADEPTAGFGGATCYWTVTTPDKNPSSEDVLNRKGAIASGSEGLDSATYINNIPLDNMNKATDYKVNAVVVDGSENVSEVASIELTTADELQRLPVFTQDFDVEGQGYHFNHVVAIDDQEIWTSRPNSSDGEDVGSVRASIGSKSRDIWQEAWVMVGPIDLSDMSDIMVSADFIQIFGNYDHMSAHISKKYDPATGEVDLNDWVQISGIGDMEGPLKETLHADWEIDASLGMDTAGVYIGFYYNHNVWNYNYKVLQCDVYATSSNEVEAPVIDWFGVDDVTTTSINTTFNASAPGRMFYYVVEDGTEAPDQAKAISGEGADAFGYLDYTVGAYIDQQFEIDGLKPNTKYNAYITFRDLLYNWSAGVYYDDFESTFETLDLQMTKCEAVKENATSVTIASSAPARGIFYYTVKPRGEEAPGTLEEVLNSFHQRGSSNYSVEDGTEVEWDISGLVPGEEYDAYVVLSDENQEYGSEIQKLEVATPNIKVLEAAGSDPIQVNDTTDLYNIDFVVKTSSKGNLYMMVTEKDAAVPSVDEVMSGNTDGAYFANAEVVNPDSINVQVEELTPALSQDYEAWFVVHSGSYTSKVFAMGRTLDYTYSLQMKVTDKNGKPLPNIKVMVGSSEQFTNVSGEVLEEGLPEGDIAYEITKGNYVESGSVLLDADKSVTVAIEEKYTAEIVAKDTEGNLLEGVSVTLGDSTFVTGIDGKAVFADLIPGIYNYEAVRDDATKTGEVDLSVDNANAEVIYEVTTSFAEFREGSISIYPNPVSDYLNVVLSENGDLTLTDISGKSVLNKTLNAGANSVDVSGLNTGVYILSIYNADNELLKISRVIIK